MRAFRRVMPSALKSKRGCAGSVCAWLHTAVARRRAMESCTRPRSDDPIITPAPERREAGVATLDVRCPNLFWR